MEGPVNVPKGHGKNLCPYPSFCRNPEANRVEVKTKMKKGSRSLISNASESYSRGFLQESNYLSLEKE